MTVTPDVAAVGSAPVGDAGDSHSESERRLIVFSLHGEHYGLPIGCVKEIIRYTPPRVTAAAHGLVRGMVNLRGRLLPVVDLSTRLGHELELSGATRILVVEMSAGVLGLIVDSVEGVRHVPGDRVEPIPGAVAADALGAEVAAVDDQLIMLVDPERALSSVLQRAPAADAPAPRARDPRETPRPSGAPPARRRSAATPQVPRPRRRGPRSPGPSGE